MEPPSPQKQLSQADIINLFTKLYTEINNLKTLHTNEIKQLREDLEKKDKEIKDLRKEINKLKTNVSGQSSTSNLHHVSNPQEDNEQKTLISNLNHKFSIKITGNEKNLDLSTDNDNNSANKPNEKLTNEDLASLCKIKFHKIKQLYLGNNKISDLKSLCNVKFTQLQKLSLSNNDIVDLTPMENFNFPDLKELYLYNNYISDISIFAKVKFPELEKLSLFSNEIEDIDVLEYVNFKKLQLIRLDNNKISDISVFVRTHFKNLERLSLFNNNISDISILEEIEFEKLKEIWLNGNHIDLAVSKNEEIYNIVRDKGIKIII